MSSHIPVLGVGLGWRREIAKEINENKEHIDWCEVISEHFINVTRDKLEFVADLSRKFPIIPHGVDLSIGTDVPLEAAYLDGLAQLVDIVDAPWYTDHLCFTRVPGYNIGQLTPLRFSEQVIEIVTRKVREIKRRIDKPFLLENISYQFKIPGGEMNEAEFLTRIVTEADTGILLDVCNLHFNALNHGFDPREFVRSIPLERVVQLHLAGGFQNNGKWYDSHSFPVHEEVFDLMEYIVARAPVRGVLLERDDNFPESFQELTAELDRAREIFRKYQPQPEFA